MAQHRRPSPLEALANWLSVEARRLSLLGAALRQVRKALNLLTREVLVCIAIVIGIWHLLADSLWRLVSVFWK